MTAISFAEPADSLILKKGSRALQFQITDDFRLSSFQGSVFSGKLHFSDRSAFRLGLSLNGRLSSTDSEQNSIIDTTRNDKRNGDLDRDDFNANLTMQYIFYNKPHHHVSMFWGSGPSVSYLLNNDDQKDEDIFSDPNNNYDRRTSISKNRSTLWQFGLSNVMGVEWFVTKKLGLSAENRFLISYFTRNYNSTRETTFYLDAEPVSTQKQDSENDEKGVTFSGINVLFGVSVYF